MNTLMPAHKMLIRAMLRADLEAVLAVQAQCYPPSMRETAPVVLARIDAAARTCLVAQDGEGVCGYLFAYPSRPGKVTPLGGDFDVAAMPETLYLHDLSVAPRAHGRGLARRLVTHVLVRAGEEGFTASALVSVQDTTAFWTALGYQASEAACPAARAALASYPGAARYMVRTLAAAVTAPGAPSQNC